MESKVEEVVGESLANDYPAVSRDSYRRRYEKYIKMQVDEIDSLKKELDELMSAYREVQAHIVRLEHILEMNGIRY